MQWEQLEGKITTFLNPFSYFITRDYKELKEFQVLYDGVSLCVLESIFDGSSVKRKRYSFDDTSLAPVVFSNAVRRSLSVGIIGSTEETICKARTLIEKKYPGIHIPFAYSGYLDADQYAKAVEDLFGCDIVVCGMGTPNQEALLLRLKSRGWHGTGFTCGGYFDQFCSTSGADYYPALIDKLNLRWAYRLYKEPRRLWKRYLLIYPAGMSIFIQEKLRALFRKPGAQEP
ncbi:WecB/TagA/CpsF family glycosyltransferase [Marinobacterium aestuariivivens]|uniref:WecB/TagA/CpsF family glycosyltransferase n=1 Tax=Marinobacterium aestuariivivens TaxID=1698799 RepID=A0ABW1ZZC6_9GAMM